MSAAEPIPHRATDTDRLMQLSLLLKALDDLDSELAIAKAQHKEQRARLEKELSTLRWEVLSGQERLPLEPLPAPTIVAVMEKVAEQVNAGALDRDGIKCTAEVGPVSESSFEEIRRTRKPKDFRCVGYPARAAKKERDE
jgi:hypothetical protein